MTSDIVEYSIIMETYNLAEGSSVERFRQSLNVLSSMIPRDDRAEIIVADVNGVPGVKTMLNHDYPWVKCISADGLGYDQAKMKAVNASSGRYLLFIDSDCIPDLSWREELLGPLRSGTTVACGGYTTYGEGWLASLMTIMDWGVFYPRTENLLKSYASNNCGFVREILEAIPMVQTVLRCNCYCHTQNLLRSGIEVLFVPRARVHHELPAIVQERSRRGYDMIASCWVDSKIPEAKWLHLGVLSIFLFYLANILTDWTRIWISYKELKLSFWQVLVSLPLFPIFRILDAGGMAYAFLRGPQKGGWGGFAW